LFEVVPEVGIEDVSVFGAQVVQVWSGSHQETGKLLGENVVGANAVPGLTGHFLLVSFRFGNVAEVGVGDQLNFVVIVEDDPLYSGNAKVFQQQVSGEDVGRGELFDGPASSLDCSM